ncbi:hypothetical protein D3C87_766480 [compost metagenome]
MKLSHEAHTILSFAWKDETPMATNFIIDNTYEVNGTKLKPTENTYEELVKYQEVTNKPYKLARTGKIVNVTGRKIV